MMMRRLAAPTLALLLLTGCGGGLQSEEPGSVLGGEAIAPVEEEEAETASALPEGAIVDYSGDFVYDGALIQVGDDENGYIQVPMGFIRFQDEDVEGLTQYSDPTGKNIVTLEQYDGISYTTAAESLRSYLASDENIEDMQGATVEVAGYNALQLYGHYTDGYFIVTWFIENPADSGSSYYLAMEFDSDHSYIMACSSTFQTVEDYNASKKEEKAEQE